MHVTLTKEARDRPSPLNSVEDWHLVSCLHSIGCAFILQDTSDADLNELIAAVEGRKDGFPLSSATRLLKALKGLDWKVYIEEVADMHGEINRDRFRRTTEQVIGALSQAVKDNRDLTIGYWGS